MVLTLLYNKDEQGLLLLASGMSESEWRNMASSVRVIGGQVPQSTPAHITGGRAA